MGRVVARLLAGLGEVVDWPLPIAVDYLHERGFGALEGWNPSADDWRFGMSERIRRRSQEIAEVVLCAVWFESQGRWARLWISWGSEDGRGPPPLNWALTGRSPFLWVSSAIRHSSPTTLHGIVQAWGDKFEEAYLCDCYCCLWLAQQCYYRE